MNRSFFVYGALLVAIQGLGACGNNPVEEPTDIAVTAETGASDKLVVAFGDSLYISSPQMRVLRRSCRPL